MKNLKKSLDLNDEKKLKDYLKQSLCTSSLFFLNGQLSAKRKHEIIKWYETLTSEQRSVAEVMLIGRIQTKCSYSFKIITEH